jgi:hypothetical protein
MKLVEELLIAIDRDHKKRPPASPAELEQLKTMGMPDDVIYFYSRSNGALIHPSNSDYDISIDGSHWLWEILPVCEILSIADSGWSHTDSPLHQRHKKWFQIVDVQNGDYLSIALDSTHPGEILDTFHETLNMVNYNHIIAKSFSELIARLLDSRDAYWLKGEVDYGYY